MEIFAPTKRSKSLPCSNKTCLNDTCSRREYVLTKAQKKRLELAQRLVKDKECVPSICTVERCRRRVYPRFIKMSFCVKAKCPNLEENKAQCSLRPKPSGRVSLERRASIIRQRGKTSGWFYRKVK